MEPPRSNRPSHRWSEFKIQELETMLTNTVTIATITAVNNETMTATARVFDDLDGFNVFVLGSGSGNYSQWVPPKIGDKVLLLSSNGDFNGSYALPIRLPEAFDSNITGAIVRAGDVTIRYNPGDNTYKINHGNNHIKLSPSSIEIKYADNNVTVNSSGVQANAGGSNISLTNSACNISVSGGVLSITSGSLTFNGQEVHRG